MTEADILAMLSRITRQAPIDLDALLATTPAVGGKGVAMIGAAQHPPSSQLWARNPDGPACIGVRVFAPVADVAALATRLASAALERHLTPIILTTLPSSGFERFGFRVERLLAASPEELALQEAELTRFWNLAIVIDAQQVAALK